MAPAQGWHVNSGIVLGFSLQVIMMCQHLCILGSKCTILLSDVGNVGRDTCVGAAGLSEICVPRSQVFCKPKTALKKLNLWGKNWCLLWLCKGCFWQRYLNINNDEVNTSISNLKSYRSMIIFTPPFFPLAEVILWLCFDQKYGFMSSQLIFGVEDFSDKSRNFRYKFKSLVAGTVQWLTKVIPPDLSSWSPCTPTCTFLHTNTIDREVCSGTWRASLWGRQVWQWSEAEQWTQNQFWLMKREVWCFWELQKKMLFSLIRRLRKPKLSSPVPPSFQPLNMFVWRHGAWNPAVILWSWREVQSLPRPGDLTWWRSWRGSSNSYCTTSG